MSNAMNKYIAQFKREIIENKWSLLYTPLIVSAVYIISVAIFIYYWLFVLKQPLDKGVTLNDMLIDVMYTNCAMIMTLYFLLSLNYLSNCLYEDRKNKQILFWRSMPVSETLAVSTKVSVIMLFMPLMVLLLNLLITGISSILGAIYLSLLDASAAISFPSHDKAHAFILPFEVFKDNLLGMLFMFPFIGYFLLVSAWVKRFPLIIALLVPSLVVYIDFLLDKMDLTIGVLDLCKQYFYFWQDIGATFILREPFVFQWEYMGSILFGMAIGGALIAGSIWLRNNRYEI